MGRVKDDLGSDLFFRLDACSRVECSVNGKISLARRSEGVSRKERNVLAFAFHRVGSFCTTTVDTLGINDRRAKCREQRNRSLEFFFTIRKKGPVGAVTSTRWVLVDLHEHVLANREIVTNGILYSSYVWREYERGEGKLEKGGK